MKSTKLLCLFFLFTACFLIHIEKLQADSGNSVGEKFLAAVKAYENGDFASSAAKFEEIAEKHKISNHGLFYNIGNSYLKQNNYGMAMLWYERAAKLAPLDPDLKFNIEYLEKRLQDDFETSRSVFSETVFFLGDFMSGNSVVKAAVIINFILWVSVAAFYFSGKNIIKPVIVFMGTASLVFILNAIYCYYDAAFIKKAVIVSPEASVRSGTSEKAPELFRLHSGTRVLVMENLEGYMRISDGDSRTGWVKAGEAVLVSGI